MAGSDHLRGQTESQLVSERLGFSGAYMAVKYLRTHIDKAPCQTTAQTRHALVHVIQSSRFQRKKQVFFLFSEAADALVALAKLPDCRDRSDILEQLCAHLARATGARARALGTALGRLPVTFSHVRPDSVPTALPLTLPIETLFSAFAPEPGRIPAWQGRSLVVPLQDARVGVIKFARSQSDIDGLREEILWMDHLGSLATPLFHVPRPLKIRGRSLFAITSVPGGPDPLFNGVCIAFSTRADYYDYPNEGRRPVDQLKSVFLKNARALGWLTRLGLFHTALIPLFHNRTQQGRRNDNGAYLWEHGGRLDQWLGSCRFPNFAGSGLRDFEHFVAPRDSGKLGHVIGEHLLSFILVIGSCFRNKAPERRGWDPSGTPVDTRDLFSLPLFTDLIEAVCQAYFQGLARAQMPEALKPAIGRLAEDLIQAMGQDWDMEEVLRVQDQNAMDDRCYREFLHTRGMDSLPPKGASDITLMTGPHLGGFNQSISVPGLVDFLFNFSSLCVSYCFARENRLKAFEN